MKKLIVLLAAVVCTCANVLAQTCTQASQATGGNCAGAPGTTATDNQFLSSLAYVKDNQRFNNYTVNTGGELVICAGGKLDVGNLSINGGSVYVHAGGTLVVGNMNTNNATITNYGTFTFTNTINMASSDEIYNQGVMSAGGLTVQGSGVRFTNNAVMTLNGRDLMINSDGFVNNAIILDISYFRINSAGVCLGNNSTIVCQNFNNNSSNAVVVNSGTANMIVQNEALNNQDVTNTSNTFQVALLNNCGGPQADQWGTADTICGQVGVSIFATASDLYFSKSTGSLHDVANWGDHLDGSGNNPPNFTGAGRTYVITNRAAADITSNWTISGAGTVLYVGDRISPVLFEINSADLDFQGANFVITAKSAVKVASGRSVTFDPNSTLWISSNDAGDGYIGEVNGDISGLDNNNVIMNRYIPANATRVWSFLASPLDAGTIADNWQHQIHVTGPVGTGGVACSNADSTSEPTANSSNGLDPNPSGGYSMYWFDESVAPGTTGQWQPVTNTISNSNPEFQLTKGNGFRVLVRGPRDLGCYLVGTAATGTLPARRDVTLTVTGSVPDVTGGVGTLNVPYSTSNGNVYVMTGNPFPATLNFGSFRTDASNVSNINAKYWIYSPEFAAGTYSSYASGVLSNRPSNYAGNGSEDDLLGQWQAFIVELASAGSGNLAFKQGHKSTSPFPFRGSFKTTATPIADLFRIRMSTDAGANPDEVAIRFVNEPSVTNANYSNFDAISMNGLAAQYLQTIKDTYKMAIQARRPLVTRDTVALNIGSYAGGIFKFNANGMSSFTNTDIYLLDRLNNTLQHLNSDSDYTFTIDIANTATLGANRFAVIFSKYPNAVKDPGTGRYKAYPLPVSDKLNLELPGNNETYTVVMTGMTGNVVYRASMNAGQNMIDVRSYAAGTYMLKITDEKGGMEVIKVVLF